MPDNASQSVGQEIMNIREVAVEKKITGSVAFHDPEGLRRPLPPEVPLDCIPDDLDIGTTLRELPLFALFPCVYFLYKGNTCVYVGQTVNLSQRVYTHMCGIHWPSPIDFDRVLMVHCVQEELNDVELYFIKALRPHYNSKQSKESKKSIDLAKVFRRKIRYSHAPVHLLEVPKNDVPESGL